MSLRWKELTELRDEAARLRDENAQLRASLEAKRTAPQTDVYQQAWRHFVDRLPRCGLLLEDGAACTHIGLGTLNSAHSRWGFGGVMKHAVVANAGKPMPAALHPAGSPTCMSRSRHPVHDATRYPVADTLLVVLDLLGLGPDGRPMEGERPVPPLVPEAMLAWRKLGPQQRHREYVSANASRYALDNLGPVPMLIQLGEWIATAPLALLSEVSRLPETQQALHDMAAAARARADAMAREPAYGWDHRSRNVIQPVRGQHRMEPPDQSSEYAHHVPQLQPTRGFRSEYATQFRSEYATQLSRRYEGILERASAGGASQQLLEDLLQDVVQRADRVNTREEALEVLQLLRTPIDDPGPERPGE